MNLDYLKYFQILARTEHYTRAAEELGIAQSSLSHAIHCLEQELGTSLFKKQGRNIVLTHQGSQYLQYVDSALQILDTGKKQLQENINGVISIGMISSMRGFVIQKIQEFKEKNLYSNCQFSLHEATTFLLIENLQKEHLDFIISSSPSDDDELTSTVLCRQDLVVIQSVEHPLFSGDVITVFQLAKLPLLMHTSDTSMRKIADSLFSLRKCLPSIAGEASEDNLLTLMVSAGMGVALVTDSPDIHQPGIRVIQLDDPINYRYVYLVRKKGRFLPPNLHEFIHFLQQ